MVNPRGEQTDRTEDKTEDDHGLRRGRRLGRRLDGMPIRVRRGGSVSRPVSRLPSPIPEAPQDGTVAAPGGQRSEGPLTLGTRPDILLALTVAEC
jgi:hypothetical protein